MIASPPVSDVHLTREIEQTLALVDAIRDRGRREEVPGWVLVRAARASWLMGNEAWAKDFYGRAATPLSEYAQETGHRTGTVEQYARLALSAAWACGDREILVEIARSIDLACEQVLSSVELPPDALTRVALLLTRLRAAWYRGQSTMVRDHVAEIERRTGGLDAWGKAAWQVSRGPVSLAAVKAIVALRPEPGRSLPPTLPGQPSRSMVAIQAVQAVDQFIHDGRARPPMLSDLVDEELLSLVAALRDHNLPLPALRSPVEPRRSLRLAESLRNDRLPAGSV
jgi:hypothetical protein